MTIKHVARAAGVSIATVSRVWSGKGPVSEATRRRVLMVARRLHYAPDHGARSLVTRRTHTVGVLLPELHGESFADLLRGIDRVARRGGFHILVSGFHGGVAELVAGLLAARGRVDGWIAGAPPSVDPGRLMRHVPGPTPLVLLNGTPPVSPRFTAVTIDNEGGARAVVGHLAALGHRRIAFIAGPRRSAEARQRLRGYRRGVRACGALTSRSLETQGDFSELSGERAGRRIARMDPRPTAVFAANDTMAIGALSALRSRGIDVPERIALVGFGDMSAARFAAPPLTTVRAPMELLGSRAMEHLLAALESDGARTMRRSRDVVPATLIVRASCGPPA